MIGTYIEITKGLTPGQKVVIHPSASLSSGSHIKLKE